MKKIRSLISLMTVFCMLMIATLPVMAMENESTNDKYEKTQSDIYLEENGFNFNFDLSETTEKNKRIDFDDGSYLELKVTPNNPLSRGLNGEYTVSGTNGATSLNYVIACRPTGGDGGYYTYIYDAYRVGVSTVGSFSNAYAQVNRASETLTAAAESEGGANISYGGVYSYTFRVFGYVEDNRLTSSISF